MVIRMTFRRILLLTELDPVVPAAVLESASSEFRRMMVFIVDLFPQAAGSPSVPPAPRALFEDFFSSSAPPPSPVFLNWFERIRSALSEADSRLARFVASGHGDYLFLPSRSSTYAVHGDFALGGTAPVIPSLLSLFEHRLKPSNHVGLSIHEAAPFEVSLRSQSEALSYSMWVLSALLAFVQLQNFAPEDLSLFNTLVRLSLQEPGSSGLSDRDPHGLLRFEAASVLPFSPSRLLFGHQQACDVVVSGCFGVLFVCRLGCLSAAR